MRKLEPDPRKEEILEGIAKKIAHYKKGPEDIRPESEIADHWFNYLNLMMDKYCHDRSD